MFVVFGDSPCEFYHLSVEWIKNLYNRGRAVESREIFSLTEFWFYLVPDSHTVVYMVNITLAQSEPSSSTHSFIHSVFCLTTVPKPVLHTVQFSASPINFQYPLVALRSYSSCSRLLHCLPATFILPSFFPSIMCFWRQSLRNMRQNQLAFLLFLRYSYFTKGLTVTRHGTVKATRQYPSHRGFGWAPQSV